MRKYLLLAFILIFAFIKTSAQDITFPELEGFKQTNNYPVFAANDLWSFIDGAADTYLALGFIDLHVTEYKKGKESIKLEIYRHSDHIMAFGIYASERSSTYRFINLGSQGYTTGGAINFFRGNYYVKIKTYSEKSKTLHAEEALATRVADMLGGETAMPSVLTLFPSENKKVNEETFVNESVLGHDFLKKAFKADYTIGSDNFSVFIIKSATPQEAEKTSHTLLSGAGIEPGSGDNMKYVFTDGYNGNIFLSWRNDLIVIISGLAKDQSDIADKYTSEILR